MAGVQHFYDEQGIPNSLIQIINYVLAAAQFAVQLTPTIEFIAGSFLTALTAAPKSGRYARA